MSDDRQVLEAIENIKALNQEQHERLQQLIKSNHSNLTADIKEIKEELKTLKLNDKDQQVEIAKLWANADKIEKELNTFQDNEKNYGRQFSQEIAKLKALPWKIAGLITAATTAIFTAAAILIKYFS